MTGDTIVQSEKLYNKVINQNGKNTDNTDNSLLISPQIPDPVFFCSIGKNNINKFLEIISLSDHKFNYYYTFK